MININSLEKNCPTCNGQGRLENPVWTEFWAKHEITNDWFRSLDVEDHEIIADKLKEQPAEPLFFICKTCHGKGKILTDDGDKLMKFIKYWLNPNYL